VPSGVTNIDNYLVPSIGMYRLDRIDVKLVETRARRVRDGEEPGEGLSPRTVNKILTTGAAICKFAMRRGLMKSKPLRSCRAATRKNQGTRRRF